MTLVLACTDCGKELKPNPKRKGTLCKPCNARALARDPVKQQKCRAAMKAKFEDSTYRAAHVARCKSGLHRAIRSNPELRARMAESGRQLGLLVLPGQNHPAGSPVRMKAGAGRSRAAMAWCPLAYHEEYRFLKRVKLLSAPAARAAIEELIARDTARYLKTGVPQLAARKMARA